MDVGAAARAAGARRACEAGRASERRVRGSDILCAVGRWEEERGWTRPIEGRRARGVSIELVDDRVAVLSR